MINLVLLIRVSYYGVLIVVYFQAAEFKNRITTHLQRVDGGAEKRVGVGPSTDLINLRTKDV